MRIATAEQMRNMDKMAIEEKGIPSTLLMERAAEGFAQAAYEEAVKYHALKRKKQIIGKDAADVPLRAVVFCGSGNNGGDGVAAARLLLKKGMQVRAFLVGSREHMTPDCREMERRLVEVDGCLEDFLPESDTTSDLEKVSEQQNWCQETDVILDAVFGIGLNKEVHGIAAQALAWMNESPAPVVSADIASGIEADTGRILGYAVHADVTVTFTCPKAGHFVGKGALHTGRLIVHPIGIPEIVQALFLGQPEIAQAFFPKQSEDGKEVLDSLEVLSMEETAALLPVRPEDGHKGTFGKVYVLGGSTGFTGAPVFSCKAAVRSGSGLVFAGVPRQIYGIIAGQSQEAMPYPLACDQEGKLNMEALWGITARIEQCDAVLIGPGLGRSEELSKLVCMLLTRISCPLVLDADGLYAIRKNKELLKKRAEQGYITVLTPHDGEFVYLGGDLSDKDRINAAKSFASEYGCILVLKGHGTLIAGPDGHVFVNATGNSGMAKGGSGDVLAGMILSFLGQGMNALDATALAVWIHGRSGDLCAQKLSVYAMNPSDMIEMLPRVFLELEASRKR